MQKWEYCVVSGIGPSLATSYPAAYRMTARGIEIVMDFKKLPKGASEINAVAQLIAQLGEEGWEMVGSGNTGSGHHSLYFKRLRAQA